MWVGIDGLNNRDLLQAGVVEEGFTMPSTPAPTDWPIAVPLRSAAAERRSTPGGKICQPRRSAPTYRFERATALRCPFSKCHPAGGRSRFMISRAGGAPF